MSSLSPTSADSPKPAITLADTRSSEHTVQLNPPDNLDIGLNILSHPVQRPESPALGEMRIENALTPNEFREWVRLNRKIEEFVMRHLGLQLNVEYDPSAIINISREDTQANPLTTDQVLKRSIDLLNELSTDLEKTKKLRLENQKKLNELIHKGI